MLGDYFQELSVGMANFGVATLSKPWAGRGGAGSTRRCCGRQTAGIAYYTCKVLRRGARPSSYRFCIEPGSQE